MGCLGGERIMGCRDEAWRNTIVLGDFVKVVPKRAVALRSDFTVKLELPVAILKKVPLGAGEALTELVRGKAFGAPLIRRAGLQRVSFCVPFLGIRTIWKRWDQRDRN
jgi:hypothetical protein